MNCRLCRIVLLLALAMAIALLNPACKKKAHPDILSSVPVYPAGKVLEKTYDNPSNPQKWQIRMLTSADNRVVLKFYEDRLGRLGWRRLNQFSENLESDFYAVYRKGTRQVTISVLPADNGNDWLHVLNYQAE